VFWTESILYSRGNDEGARNGPRDHAWDFGPTVGFGPNGKKEHNPILMSQRGL
jgi:hypothetical protein